MHQFTTPKGYPIRCKVLDGLLWLRQSDLNVALEGGLPSATSGVASGYIQAATAIAALSRAGNTDLVFWLDARRQEAEAHLAGHVRVGPTEHPCRVYLFRGDAWTPLSDVSDLLQHPIRSTVVDGHSSALVVWVPWEKKGDYLLSSRFFAARRFSFGALATGLGRELRTYSQKAQPTSAPLEDPHEGMLPPRFSSPALYTLDGDPVRWKTAGGRVFLHIHDTAKATGLEGLPLPAPAPFGNEEYASPTAFLPNIADVAADPARSEDDRTAAERFRQWLLSIEQLATLAPQVLVKFTFRGRTAEAGLYYYSGQWWIPCVIPRRVYRFRPAHMAWARGSGTTHIILPQGWGLRLIALDLIEKYDPENNSTRSTPQKAALRQAGRHALLRTVRAALAEQLVVQGTTPPQSPITPPGHQMTNYKTLPFPSDAGNEGASIPWENDDSGVALHLVDVLTAAQFKGTLDSVPKEVWAKEYAKPNTIKAIFQQLRNPWRTKADRDKASVVCGWLDDVVSLSTAQPSKTAVFEYDGKSAEAGLYNLYERWWIPHSVIRLHRLEPTALVRWPQVGATSLVLPQGDGIPLIAIEALRAYQPRIASRGAAKASLLKTVKAVTSLDDALDEGTKETVRPGASQTLPTPFGSDVRWSRNDQGVYLSHSDLLAQVPALPEMEVVKDECGETHVAVEALMNVPGEDMAQLRSWASLVSDLAYIKPVREDVVHTKTGSHIINVFHLRGETWFLRTEIQKAFRVCNVSTVWRQFTRQDVRQPNALTMLDSRRRYLVRYGYLRTFKPRDTEFRAYLDRVEVLSRSEGHLVNGGVGATPPSANEMLGSTSIEIFQQTPVRVFADDSGVFVSIADLAKALRLTSEQLAFPVGASRVIKNAIWGSLREVSPPIDMLTGTGIALAAKRWGTPQLLEWYQALLVATLEPK